MTTALPASPTWTAWHRAGSSDPWRALGHGTEAECWDLALSVAQGGDTCVLAAGRDPNERLARR